MNKYQEAWNNVRSLAETSDYYKECDDKDIELIHELVEKSTPKKTIYKIAIHKRGVNRYVCGNCQERFPYIALDGINQCMYHYCPYCGQKADWSD